MEQEKSYFDGNIFEFIGYSIISTLIVAFTLGLGLPWAYCLFYRWEASHTIINGRRLEFDGTALQLLGNWIKWFFLSVITLGLYFFWTTIKLKQWKAKHTHFAK